MKKVGIISLYYNNLNFGGQLQAFSLQKFIEKSEVDSEQICYSNQCRNPVYYYEKIKNLDFKCIHIYIYKLFNKIINKIFKLPYRKFLSKRKKAFLLFSESIPHSCKVYEINNIKESNLEYDGFVVGSDCVWGISEKEEVSCLCFADKDKRKISYAASLGCSAIPEGWAERYLDGIKQLDAIAVREESIAKELKELVPHNNIYVTVDPTLLFTASEWNAFLPSTQVEGKYALIYILSEDKFQCKCAEQWARNNHLKSYVFPYIHNTIRFWQNDYGELRDFSSGPLEFVSLIKNADVIITDSFHASIFSVLFHKPFIALVRETEKEYVGRVENLLEDLRLTSQLVVAEKFTEIKGIPNIDFSYADNVIEKKRIESIKYLKDNLI